MCCREQTGILTLASDFSAQLVTGASPPTFPQVAATSDTASQGHMAWKESEKERSSASRPVVGWWPRASGSACCAWMHLGCDMSLHFQCRQPFASLRQPSYTAMRYLSLLWLWSWKHRKKLIIYCWFCYMFWLGKEKMCRHVPIACPGSALSSNLLLPRYFLTHSFFLLYTFQKLWD